MGTHSSIKGSLNHCGNDRKNAIPGWNINDVLSCTVWHYYGGLAFPRANRTYCSIRGPSFPRSSSAPRSSLSLPCSVSSVPLLSLAQPGAPYRACTSSSLAYRTRDSSGLRHTVRLYSLILYVGLGRTTTTERSRPRHLPPRHIMTCIIV